MAVSRTTDSPRDATPVVLDSALDSVLGGPSGRREGGRTRRSKFTLQRRGPLYWFAAPALCIYGLFFVVPTLQALYYSLFNWQGPGTSPAYIGIENFKTKLNDDTTFHNSVWVSLKFMLIVVVVQTLIALMFSLLLVRNSKANIFLRALYFFPTILSSSAVAFVWNFVYDPSSGLVSTVLEKLGLSYRPALMASPKTAIIFLAIVQVWFHAGQMMVVFVAGLQQIPKDYVEAAAIDGATRWQSFRKVTWPLLGPATAIVVAYTTLQSFRAFDLVLIMTEGGPLNSTRVLGFHIYRTAFEAQQYGEAATESVIFMALIALITFLQRRVLRLTRADVSGAAS
jgi:raffinose/stachyose/melibiose transport system permease protein